MVEKSKDRFVIDSSFMLCYLMPDEYDDKVQQVFDQYKNGLLKLISLPLLPYEVTNGLYAAILSKRIESQSAPQLIRDFLQFPIGFEGVDYSIVLKTAEKYHISVYDASYITLSEGKHIPLLTLDNKLKKLAS